MSRDITTVDLLGRYSNPDSGFAGLRDVIARLHGRLLCGETAVERPIWREPHVRLDGRRVDELIAAYVAGETQADLARRFGVHEQRVGRLLDRAGIERRKMKLSMLVVAEAVALYGDGWSLRRIGAQYGVAAETVGAALRAAGVELRKPGRRRT